MVILCYPAAFAPSVPVPDPNSGVSGMLVLVLRGPLLLLLLLVLLLLSAAAAAAAAFCHAPRAC